MQDMDVPAPKEQQQVPIDPRIDLRLLVQAGHILDRLFGDIDDDGMKDMDASYFVDHAGEIFQAGRLAGKAFDKTHE